MTLRAAVLIAATLLSTGAAPADDTSVFPDPGLTLPRLRFATGNVVNNQPEISSVLPDIPGRASGWYVSQFHVDSYLQPTDLRLGSSLNDSRFGHALYVFSSRDDSAQVEIFRKADDGYVFGLLQDNGTIMGGGGTNLFLSAHAVVPAALDRDVIYELDARIAQASIRYDTPDAKESGAVLGNAGSGFVMQFAGDETTNGITLFAQIPITSSRLRPPDYRGCSVNRAGGYVITVDHLIDPAMFLPFRADTGALHHLRYDLGELLDFASHQSYRCQDARSGETVDFRMSAAAMDPSGWKLKAMYVGLETENQDHRANSADRSPQGAVRVELQIANLRVTRSP